MQKSNTIYGAAAALLLCAAALAQAKSFESKRDESLEAEDNSVSAVIPSPNADGLGDYAPLYAADIQRNSAAAAAASAHEANLKRHQQEATSASDESGVPVYVSPFARADSHTASHARHPLRFEHSDASSHAPPNYAPRPAASAPSGDLKTSASYGKFASNSRALTHAQHTHTH